METCGSLQKAAEAPGSPQKHVEAHKSRGSPWKPMEACGSPWKPMEAHGSMLTTASPDGLTCLILASCDSKRSCPFPPRCGTCAQ